MHTPGLFGTKNFTFMSDVAACEEFYSIVKEIDNPQLQQKIQAAVNKIITPWTQRQDDLIHALNQLEQSYSALQQDTQVHSTMYHKAIRDLQFYKAKCNQLSQYNADDSQHINNTSGTKRMDYQSLANIDTSSSISITSSSDYSHYKSSPSISDDHSSISFSNSLLPISDDHNDPFDILSLMSQNHTIYIPPQKPPPSIDLPLPPIPSPSKKNTALPPQENHFQTPPKPASTEELKFACGDGFWNTIAKGKSNKNEVDLLIKNYLKRGGQANVANNSGTIQSIKEGYGLIHALIAIKNTSALKRIIQAGANPHALPLQAGTSEQNNRISPLVLAAQLGYLNGVRLLVELAHANVLSSKGPRQENALFAAIQANALDVVMYLLKVSNRLLDQADIFGATPLHYACMTGKTKMISYLVRECGQLPDATDYKGETPLHYAIRHRQPKAVAFLVGELEAYPNTYIVKKVPTPLDLAKAKGLRTVAEFLKKMGAKTTKEMEKKSSSIFTSSNGIESSSDIVETSDISLASNHHIHSDRSSTSNENI